MTLTDLVLTPSQGLVSICAHLSLDQHEPLQGCDRPDLIAHDLKSPKHFFFVGSTLSFCVDDFRNPVLTTL